jgi:ParB family chromosome partitioning protein
MSREPAKRLGRGLAALLGETPAAGPEASVVRQLPLAALEPGPFQARAIFDQQAMSDLADSIRAQGILQPLLVRQRPDAEGRYQIIAGERRWRAAQLAGLHEVPAVVRAWSDHEAQVAGLIENLQREDLNPAEEAEGLKRLQDEQGLTAEQIGAAIGKSRSHVANTLRLLGLPGPVLDLLRNGTLSAGHARALLAHPNPAAAAEIVVSRGLNVRQAEALAAATQSSPPAKRGEDPETQALARNLSERLGLRVDIEFNRKGGTVRIRYSTLDQLDGVVSLLQRS